MSWIGLTDFERPLFRRKGIGATVAPLLYSTSGGEDILLQGTLMLEAEAQRGRSEPMTLVDIGADNADGRQILIRLHADGTVQIALCDGERVSEARLATEVTEREAPFRLALSWDVTQSAGTLSVEDLVLGTLWQTDVAAAAAIATSDVMALIGGDKPHGAEDLIYYAIADSVEPVGLTPSFARNTPIDTPAGPALIDALSVGDLVITEDHGAQPIRWIGNRVVPALGAFRPIRLRAPYFGLSRDVVVGPEHRILIEGAEVEYLFGEEQVLVEARYLLNGTSAIHAKTDPVITLYHLLLDHHEIVHVGGSAGESLYVGSLGKTPDILETTMLRGLSAARVPRHAALARPTLRGYEATTLLSLIA